MKQPPFKKLSEFLIENVPDVKLDDAKKVIVAYRHYKHLMRGTKDEVSNFCDVCYNRITEEEAIKTTVWDFNFCCDKHGEFRNAFQLELIRKQLGIEVKHLPMFDI